MLKQAVKFLVLFYQACLSAVLPPSCRYEPTCSHYALQALERHSLFYALWLTVCRICRCHPWSAGGYDPVPDPVDNVACQCKHSLERVKRG